ncbi:MAG: type II toxin-antitoxin system Phd/YefM family antitoxin [Thermoanaerobaculia bacterium]
MKAASRRVGVRQLRQNLSVYLRRVASGETLEVTERGRPVALLAPLLDASSGMQELITTGRATAPRGDLLELGPPRPGRVGRRLGEALRQERGERL